MKKGMFFFLTAFAVVSLTTSCSNEDSPAANEPCPIDLGGCVYANDTIWYEPVVEVGLDTLLLPSVPVLAVNWNAIPGEDEVTPRICNLLGTEGQVIQTGEVTYDLSPVSGWDPWQYMGSPADLGLSEFGTPARFFCNRVIVVSLYHNGRLYRGKQRLVFALGGRVNYYPPTTIYETYLQGCIEGFYAFGAYSYLRKFVVQ